MSYLKKFARPKQKENKTEVITARLPEGLANWFKQHCEGYGLSISEGIYYLVDREKQEEEKKNTSDTERIQTNTERMKQQPRRQRSAGVSGRFTVIPWEVKGRVPCPICNQWYSKGNIARHARTYHDMTTQELIEGNKEAADRMAAEARGGES